MGGSGGGGSSGRVDFPDYMKTLHEAMMDGTGVDGAVFISNLARDLNTTQLGNPYIGATAFDPDTRITNIETEIGNFETLVEALSETTDWAALFAQAVTTVGTSWTAPTPAASAEITAAVTAFEAIQDDRVETTVLPRFQRGMQDIGGVLTSAFVIGQAIIEGMTDRDVAQFQGELRTKAYLLKDQLVADSLVKKNIAYTISAEQMTRYFAIRLGAEDSFSKLYVDGQRMALLAQREEAEYQLDVDDKEAIWGIEMWRHAANLLGSIGGGSTVYDKGGPTRTQSMIGGAASGAAMGTAIGGPGWGTGIGAVVGAYMGYTSV